MMSKDTGKRISHAGDSMKKGGLTSAIWDNSAPKYLSTVMNC